MRAETFYWLSEVSILTTNLDKSNYLYGLKPFIFWELGYPCYFVDLIANFVY